MPAVRQICDHLEQLAPVRLAEEWDNVGLLIGDGDRDVNRVMTCLTVTPTSVREAIEKSADLIVTHHPMPFRAVKRLTVDSTVGRMIWELIGAQVSIYSPHTAWDSAQHGINQLLAEAFGLTNIQPLEAIDADPDGLGAGRCGDLDALTPLDDVIQTAKRFLAIDGLHCVGDRTSTVRRVAVACGSAGQFLTAAHREKCDVLVTGETNFHTCLEAEALGVALLLPGHFASERFSLEYLAEVMAGAFPSLTVWASEQETDPLQWVS
jgi:dinuclear metal center YbgI/SA1388 family protein